MSYNIKNLNTNYANTLQNNLHVLNPRHKTRQ